MVKFLKLLYIFKVKALTRTEIIKLQSKIKKWFFFHLIKKQKVLKALPSAAMLKRRKKISILRSPFVHKKFWEHFEVRHFLFNLKFTFIFPENFWKISFILNFLIFKKFRFLGYSRILERI